MRILSSAVRAWPCSSIVSAMTAVPCSLTSGMMRPNRLVGAVAVLVVDRVDDGPAADELEPGPDDGGLGRVDHEGQRRRAGEPRHDLADVGDAVATDVVDAHVEQVRADADLVARDLDAVVPAAPRASPRGTPSSRSRWCARRSRGTTRPDRTARADRATRRPLDLDDAVGAPRPPAAWPTPERTQPLDDRGEVLGRRAAASADQSQAELAHELLVRGARARPGSAGSARRRP